MVISHKVRIVGGAWKRTPLTVPDVPGLRPTPDRVRETLFNWLGQSLDGLRCLDAFAGSGSLGLEAASRGAARVVMIERDRIALAGIRRAIERLGAQQVELLSGDAIAAFDRLVRAGERFDLVIFMGVLYHLRHPLLALDLIREHVADDLMLYQSLTAGSTTEPD
ncbi:MAG: RsmD family RNA methyltransferase, partial [Gammaproteobacteria bacterium]